MCCRLLGIDWQWFIPQLMDFGCCCFVLTVGGDLAPVVPLAASCRRTKRASCWFTPQKSGNNTPSHELIHIPVLSSDRSSSSPAQCRHAFRHVTKTPLATSLAILIWLMVAIEMGKWSHAASNRQFNLLGPFPQHTFVNPPKQDSLQFMRRRMQTSIPICFPFVFCFTWSGLSQTTVQVSQVWNKVENGESIDWFVVVVVSSRRCCAIFCLRTLRHIS